MQTYIRAAPHRPCSAKRERSLPESESSSWPAAKMKTKCSSRKRTGHSCEHRIFHVAKVKALEKSRGRWSASGEHFDAALHCVMTLKKLRNLPSRRERARTEEDWEPEGESPGSTEEGGEECTALLWASGYFSL